jgi:hypothetical protein
VREARLTALGFHENTYFYGPPEFDGTQLTNTADVKQWLRFGSHRLQLLKRWPNPEVRLQVVAAPSDQHLSAIFGDSIVVDDVRCDAIEGLFVPRVQPGLPPPPAVAVSPPSSDDATDIPDDGLVRRPLEGVTIVKNQATLREVLLDLTGHRVIWVCLPDDSVSQVQKQQLLNWNRSGGVLWTDTDFACAMGISALRNAPDGLRRGLALAAYELKIPIVQGVGKEPFPYVLSSTGQMLLVSRVPKVDTVPLLATQSGRTTVVLCAMQKQGEGLFVFRPTLIGDDEARSPGRRFEENLRKFSLENSHPGVFATDR